MKPAIARTTPMSSRALAMPAALATAVLALTACTAADSSPAADGRLRATSSPAAPGPAPVPAGSGAATPRASTRQVAPLAARRQADVLVVSAAPLPAQVRDRLRALSDPAGTELFHVGTVTLAGRPVRAVGVDPSSFRAFTASGTAESDAVWQAVADGSAVVSHEAAGARGLAAGAELTLTGAGRGQSAAARLGALATTGVPGADLVLDAALAQRLGLAEATGALLTAPESADPVAFAARVRAVAGSASVDLLQVPAPVARLTGGAAAQDLGAFSYRYFPDGTIEPDARWVRENIRSEVVPVMGRVTCHRLMLPQLRGALQEVVAAGLAETLRTYDGCYVPRFIERDPAQPISLHTWGIAIDMDAASNYRGITGTMDPRVVAIFKRWGFRWGGDWRYTDPMHFELGTLLSAPAA